MSWGGRIWKNCADVLIKAGFCDFATLRAEWQLDSATLFHFTQNDNYFLRLRFTERSMTVNWEHTDTRDFYGFQRTRLIPVFSKHDSSSNNNKRTVTAIFTLSFCKKQFRPGTSKSWFHFLVNDVNPFFGNRSKTIKNLIQPSTFFEKTPLKIHQITEIHSCSILFQKKIIYKNVKTWILRKLLICNTWMNLDHKIISSFYHIIFPLFTKEICAPKNSC